MTNNVSVPWQYMLPTLRDKAISNPKLRILDVGCGNGSITIELARLVPEGEVIGVDESAGVLVSAREFARAKAVENVMFVTGDIYELEGLGLGRFDVVCTHQVVAHCGEPVRAVKELVKTVGEGGVLCMREGDLESGRFGGGGEEESEALQECFGVVARVHRANGGFADAGRRLVEWVEKAGVSRTRVVDTSSDARYDTLEKRREYGGHWPGRCTYGIFAEKAIELGIKRSRLEEYALAWKKWMSASDAYFTMTHGEVIVSL